MSPMDYSADGWQAPWRKGLAQAHCVNPECRRRVVEITMQRGYCRPCTVKLGVAPEVFESEQLEIPLF